MRKALKWAGWTILVLAALSAFASADKISQWGVAIIGLLWWVLYDVDRTAQKRHEVELYRLTVVEQKLDAILRNPLHSEMSDDGLRLLLEEARQRERERRDRGVDSGDTELSGEWPFPRRS